eukprot:6575579-Pyramimonas_sp.AAC.1
MGSRGDLRPGFLDQQFNYLPAMRAGDSALLGARVGRIPAARRGRARARCRRGAPPGDDRATARIFALAAQRVAT